MEPEFSLIQRDQDTLKQVAEAAKAKGRAIRFRIQPQLFDFATDQYRSWTDVVWMMEGLSAAPIHLVKQALDVFFRLLHLWGPKETLRYLQAWEEQALEQQGPPSNEAPSTPSPEQP